MELAYPVKGVAIMPPETDYNTAFQTAQNVMVEAGYSITQSNPQTGLISGQKGKENVIVYNYQFIKDAKKQVMMVMVVDYKPGPKSVLGAPPPQLARADMVRTAKMVANKVGIRENNVLIQFNGEQKPLSSY
jgi:hypothetical protein